MTTPRETINAKAARLLASGALPVTEVDGDRVTATCQGDSGVVYLLSHSPDRPGVWTCSCPAPGRCSHVSALQLVIIPNTTERTTTP